MANVNKAKLLAKMKKTAKGAWNSARDAAPKVKGQTLPGGIVRGVAQLSSYDFNEDKKGTVYFKLSFTVFEPEEFAGAKANVFHRIKATQNKTVADKLAELSSDLQLCGVDTSGTTEDDLPDLCQQAVDAAPFVYFNTWKPPADKMNPDPQTLVFLQGLADDWNPPDAGEGEAVEEEEDAEEEEAEEEEAPPPAPKPTAGKGGKKPTAKTAPEPEPEAEEEPEAEAEEEGDWEPAKGEIYNFKSNPKVKPSEHEVVKVDTKAKTVDLKSVVSGKTFAKVAWDRLEGA